MIRLLKACGRLYTRRPVLCNVAMYGTLYAAGDVSQQTILKRPKYNWENTGRLATVGATFFGPFYYYWYTFLDKLLPGKAAVTIVKKLVVDQGVAGVLGLSVFFTYLSVLEGKKNPTEELVEKGPKTYMIACLYWPAVQTINFMLLPTRYRTVFVAVAAFTWTNILSYVKSLQSGKEFTFFN